LGTVRARGAISVHLDTRQKERERERGREGEREEREIDRITGTLCPG